MIIDCRNPDFRDYGRYRVSVDGVDRTAGCFYVDTDAGFVKTYEVVADAGICLATEIPAGTECLVTDSGVAYRIVRGTVELIEVPQIL